MKILEMFTQRIWKFPHPRVHNKPSCSHHQQYFRTDMLACYIDNGDTVQEVNTADITH